MMKQQTSTPQEALFTGVALPTVLPAKRTKRPRRVRSREEKALLEHFVCEVCGANKASTEFRTRNRKGAKPYRSKECLDCERLRNQGAYQTAAIRAAKMASACNTAAGKRIGRGYMPISIRVLEGLLLNAPRCEYCHKPNAEQGMGFSFDHRIPIKHGGDHTVENIAVCCEQCNRAKYDMSEAAYRAWLSEAADRLTGTVRV